MIEPVTCILPAYQAAATLGAVAAGLRRAVPKVFLVAVDDGSSDGTRSVATATCDRVLTFARNRGKGAALRAGVNDALRHGAAAVLTVDADGQHDTNDAPTLLAALQDADVVIGVRQRCGSAMPLARRFTNRASALAMSACAGATLPDPQSGYRAIRRSVLEQIVPVGERYEYECDLLLQAARSGYRIVGVPVRTIYGPPSHFQSLDDTRLVVGAIWRHRHGAFRRRRLDSVMPARPADRLSPERGS